MADLPVSSFTTLTGANLAAGDLIPVIDISGIGAAKNSKMTPPELFSGLLRLSNGFSNPHVIYVRSDGNDTTGTGSASAPYLTAQKAYDEGVVAAQPFALSLGVGVFSITVSDSPISSLLKSVMGVGALSDSVYLTELDITNTPGDVSNTNGTSGFTFSLVANDLFLVAYANGGSVNANDMTGVYT